MEALWKDLRFSIRMLLKKPGFASVAALTLAMGIGANTAIFSVVNGVLLRPLPYKDPDRLAMLWETTGRSREVNVSHLNFIDWREQSRSFEYMAAYTGRWGGPATVIGGTEPERAYVSGVYRDFFSALGVTAAVGRTFLAEEHRPGANPVVVVSYGFWQRRLGGDRNLADKKLTVYGTSFDVVGVLPQGFSFPDGTDLWAPSELFEDTSARSAHNYEVIARLKPGVTFAEAQAEMATIGRQLEQQYPDTNEGTSVAVVSLHEQLVGDARPALLVLLAAVGFVLLIACANVANLLLARALGRQKEMAIRLALGAGRSRIIRQLLTESLMLSLVGGALGLLLAFWLVGILIALGPGDIPRIDEIGIDGRALAYTLGLCLLTSLLFGLVPALRASRPDLHDSLKAGGRSSGAGAGRQGLRHLLVVAEITLTVVLLIGAGLLTKSFWNLLQVDAGFDPEQVLIMRMSLPSSEYREGHQTAGFYREALFLISSLPGVEAAGAINNLPLAGVNLNGQVEIEGKPDERGSAGYRIVSPGYFSAMSIPLIKGRMLAEQDNENAPPVALINRSMADRSWAGEDPIGKRFRTGGMDSKRDIWVSIIGVVGDVKHRGVDAEARPEYYLPYLQRPGRAREMTVAVRTSGDPSAMVSAVRGQVQAVDKNLPVSFEEMQQVFSGSIADRRYNMLLLGAFAGAALLLSMMGIYGVMSYAVSERTQEIGIRQALGAGRIDILRLIMGRGIVLAVAGVIAGLGAALAVTRLMAGLLFGVSATDPMIFVAVSALLILVALLACYVPARRATRVDPMVALRYE
ncbi:MAG: ABC transporter permease [Blastocatellia bacterium]|nr:ABC transporter permease [Blastocatellia bacterium]